MIAVSGVSVVGKDERSSLRDLGSKLGARE
jgi:hypothetical protein